MPKPIQAESSLAAGSLAAGSLAAGSLATGSLAAGSLAAGSLAAGSLAAGSLFITILHSKNKPVKVTTNFCHNTHYFCVVTFTTFYSDPHYIHSSERHYMVVTCVTKSVVNVTTLIKIVSIVADISSDVHYI